MFDTKVAFILREELAVWRRVNVAAMFSTGHDDADREAFMAEDPGNLDPAGLAPPGSKKAGDKAVKGLALRRRAGRRRRAIPFASALGWFDVGPPEDSRHDDDASR